MIAPELIVINQIINFQPSNRLLRTLIDQPKVIISRSSFIIMKHLTKKALFFQTMNSSQNSSKSIIIHLFYILLIILKYIIIFKLMKLSKLYIKSIFSFIYQIFEYS